MARHERGIDRQQTKDLGLFQRRSPKVLELKTAVSGVRVAEDSGGARFGPGYALGRPMRLRMVCWTSAGRERM
jgi:hypothetical protein